MPLIHKIRTKACRLSCGALLAVSCGAGLVGCAAIGVIAEKTMADKPVPAQFTFPKDEPVAILIENYHNPDTVSLSAQSVAQRIYDALKERKAAKLIEPSEVESLRAAHGDAFGNLSIPEVGKLLGAKHVLYGELTNFLLEPAIGGNTVKGHTRMEVRVVNVRTGQTEWPAEITGGESVKAETSYVQLGDGVTEETVRTRLVQSLSGQAARLFYAARPSEAEEDTPTPGPQ